MDELKRKLYGSNRLRLELSDFIIPEQFCSRARDLSIKSGISIRKGELEEHLFAGRAGMMSRLPGDMSGFFQGRFFWEAGRAYVDWVYLANRTFSDPFYKDTIWRRIVTPLNLLLRFTSRLESIWSFTGQKTVPPAGFIFHVSRCGSTLVSQMLSAVDSHIVLSEPPPVDTLLRSHFHDPNMDEDRKIRLLRQMVRIMGQQRQLWERHLFIKFDSWHLSILPLIRKAFPKVPILILYRDPVEVLISHRKKPGSHMVPGRIEPEWFNANPKEVRGMNQTEYGVWVLKKLFEAALESAETEGVCYLNYTELPEALWQDGSFGMVFQPNDIEKMKQAARFDAKNRASLFEKDTEKKQQAAGESIRSLVRKHLWNAQNSLAHL